GGFIELSRKALKRCADLRDLLQIAFRQYAPRNDPVPPQPVNHCKFIRGAPLSFFPLRLTREASDIEQIHHPINRRADKRGGGMLISTLNNAEHYAQRFDQRHTPSSYFVEVVQFQLAE